MAKTLFDDFDFQEPEKALEIRPKRNAPLSKEQKEFNRLSKQILNLELKIEAEKQKLDKVRNLYAQEMTPVFEEKNKNAEKLVLALHAATIQYKLSIKSKEKASGVIEYLLDELFSEIEPTEELIAIYDQHSFATYEENLEMEKDLEKDMFTSFFKDMMDVDFDDMEEGWDPEDPATIEKLKEKLREKQEEFDRQNEKNKTKKQQEKEAIKKAEDELKTKNIRSIYIALTKVIHPDAEQDPVLKKEKEEVMKAVVAAYEQKDLSALLKFEIEWLNKSDDELAQLPEEKLKLYTSALRQRASDLKQDLHMEYMHPRNFHIQGFVHLTEIQAIRRLEQEKREVKTLSENLETNVKVLHSASSKKDINLIIDALSVQIEDDYFEDDGFYGGW